MFDRFRQSHQTLHAVDATEDEHVAALELMLLVAVSDRTVTTAELEQVENEVEEGGWETPTFNYTGKFGPAMAHVRSTAADGAGKLIDDCASRISSSELRRLVLRACRQVAAADGGESADEHAVLVQIERRLA